MATQFSNKFHKIQVSLSSQVITWDPFSHLWIDYSVGGQEKEYYTLGTLLYFLKHENVLHAEYVKTAGSAGEGVVVRPDRKVLQDYLKNEKFFEKATADAIKKIDKSVRIPT